MSNVSTWKVAFSKRLSVLQVTVNDVAIVVTVELKGAMLLWSLIV
jgi:hypothetical protein